MGAAAKSVPPAFYMTWHILVMVGAGVMLIAMLASLISIRRVVVLEPAIVFK
jgi:putative ABC transport system permease protein